MKNLFNSVKMTKLQTNLFDMSHDVKLSCNMGQLVPIMLMECIPGDKHQISCESLVRFAPLITPVMHRFDVTMHYFFVPNRILWNNWEKYITNTKDELGNQYQFPTIRLSWDSDNPNPAVGAPYTKLMDYLGIPRNQIEMLNQNDEIISALPLAAYQCVYNEYYRDQNLITPKAKLANGYYLLDGDNSTNPELYDLRYRAWEHDYYTACLPFAQKGEAVDIPLGDVVLKESALDGRSARILEADFPYQDATGNLEADTSNLMTNGVRSIIDPNGTLTTEATTINDLRRAFRLQEWLEKAARGGSRYIEWLKSMFGVTSSDKRLQRPEYITGTKSPVIISEVLNTTGTENAPQGNMSGHAISVSNGYNGSYYVEEHGFIIGIMSIMPKPAYQQGFEKHWIKYTDPTEFYFSSFANIGEQEVKNKELVAYQALGESTFGYIPRYAEYRYMQNRVAGDFRTTLKDWQFARIFNTNQQLNESFIECVPSKRIFAVIDPNEDCIYCQVYNKVMSVRPLPKYGTPTF